MRRGESLGGVFLGGVFSGALISLFILAALGHFRRKPEPIPMEYTDIAVLVLAAATFVMAVFAAVITVIGIWGYRQIKDGAVEASTHHVEQELGPNGKLRKLIAQRVDALVASAGKKTGNIEWGDEETEYGDRTK